jgi:ubiquinone/menaquinone biosynthesis C-methylase UbiE
MGNFSQSKLAASLQTVVSRRREDSGLYFEIANQLPLETAQRFLDVGTGTGLQLKVVNELQPEIGLFGLDLSLAAIEAASKALVGLDVDLRSGSISATNYPDNYFDIVSCNASMSYWEDPQGCFNEIYRILKPGGQVFLFEPHKDIDLEKALQQIKINMADESRLRRWGAVQLNKFALKRGSRIGMKLYSITELKELAASTDFGSNYEINETSLLNIPIFVRIHLWKESKLDSQD